MAVTLRETLASWNPLRCTGQEVPPGMLVMAKALCLIIVFWRDYQDILVYLPFFSGLDSLGAPLLLKRAAQALIVVGVFGVLFNRFVRVSSALVAAGLLLGMLMAREYFTNNRALVAALFAVVALQPSPQLLGWQLGVIYFGAGLNKLLEADWRDGTYFTAWAGMMTPDVYPWIAALLPKGWMEVAMGWSTILLELFLACSLPFKRLQPVAITVGVLFHSSLVLMTHSTYGYFFFAAIVAYNALGAWPERIRVQHPATSRGRLARFLAAIQADRRVEVSPGPVSELTATPNGGAPARGVAALRLCVRYTPAFYFAGVAWFLYAGTGYPPPVIPGLRDGMTGGYLFEPLSYFRNATLVAALLLFAPLPELLRALRRRPQPEGRLSA